MAAPQPHPAAPPRASVSPAGTAGARAPAPRPAGSGSPGAGGRRGRGRGGRGAAAPRAPRSPFRRGLLGQQPGRPPERPGLAHISGPLSGARGAPSAGPRAGVLGQGRGRPAAAGPDPPPSGARPRGRAYTPVRSRGAAWTGSGCPAARGRGHTGLRSLPPQPRPGRHPRGEAQSPYPPPLAGGDLGRAPAIFRTWESGLHMGRGAQSAP